MKYEDITASQWCYITFVLSTCGVSLVCRRAVCPSFWCSGTSPEPWANGVLYCACNAGKRCLSSSEAVCDGLVTAACHFCHLVTALRLGEPRPGHGEGRPGSKGTLQLRSRARPRCADGAKPPWPPPEASIKHLEASLGIFINRSGWAELARRAPGTLPA